MLLSKILIVEDDPISAKVLAHSVNQLGYEVCAIYQDAESTLENYSKDQPDLVLLDFHLGGQKDGIDLASELKNIYQIPIVMVTSVENDSDLDKILNYKPDAYIQKPIELRELRAVLELVNFKFEKDQEMAHLNKSLEQKVKERTEELDIAVKSLIKEMSAKEKIHQQLEKALKSERQFGDLKSKIITNLSHEFKTPLSSIRSSAQLLNKMIVKNKVDEKSVRHTDRIEKGVQILTNLLVRILSVERDQENIYKAECMFIDFGIFLEGLKEECEEANSKNLNIDYELDLKSEYINTDPKLIRLIITNLVNNACKYSPDESSVIVQISDSKDDLKIVVEDSGIGMDKEDQDQIFYRFFRAKNVGSIEGTGIGMSIVKRSVDALSGNISIDSELNKGTKIHVRIPISEKLEASETFA